MDVANNLLSGPVPDFGSAPSGGSPPILIADGTSLLSHAPDLSYLDNWYNDKECRSRHAGKLYTRKVCCLSGHRLSLNAAKLAH
jgi:hypothetical protein